jgi:RNA polymerase sigma-70 factor (ECF subfamily)
MSEKDRVDAGSMAELDDALAGARRGDADGFAALYRAHQAPLLRYLRSMVGPEADDVASETWLQAIRDLNRFRGNGTELRAWLVTIGRHRALDLLRAQRRRPSDAWDPALLPEGRARDDTAELTEESLATRRALALIARLPRDQAEAVLLRVVVGLDAPAAAAVMGKRAGAVRMATSRGLARLAQLLEEQGVTHRESAALKEVR